MILAVSDPPESRASWCSKKILSAATSGRDLAWRSSPEEFTPQVAPAKGDCDPLRRQLLVRGIAVALHDAAIVCEQLLEMLAASPRRVGIGDSRRVGSAPGPVITRDRPEVAGLGLAAPGIEHRHRRLID